MTWRVVGAKAVGESHKRSAAPCQDAFGWVVRSDGVLVAVVSDGAGSAPLGEVGSQVAVDAATESLRTAESPTTAAALDAAFDAAVAAVEARAEASGHPPRDLAATIIIVVAGAVGAEAIQVGDGAAVVVPDDGPPVSLTRPPVSEYVNETTFLVTPGAREAVQRASFRGALRGIALFSDGLQRVALEMPAGEPHAPFFAPLFAFAASAEGDGATRELEAFLGGARMASRTDDDRSLVLAVRVSGTAA